jgi:glucose-6-phosphate isomerase
VTQDITSRGAWASLQSLAACERETSLRQRFADDAARFENFSISSDGILLDFAKQRVSAAVMSALRDLWTQSDVPAQIAAQQAGSRLNHTEDRAVLHTALRAPADAAVYLDGRNVMPDVLRVRAQMRQFCADIHEGRWRGATGERIRHVVNLGVGGSDLGPRMAASALSAWHHSDVQVHFVANIDGSELSTTLAQCAPECTLFIVASKTFTTQETMQNARSARAWLGAELGRDLTDPSAHALVAKHFVAASTNHDAVAAFGIDPANTFEFWDWVGGRFSLWSAIGLPLALAIGMDNFEQLLAGGAAMDAHFYSAPLEQNIPATLALLDVWNTNFLGAQSRAVLPYCQALVHWERFLQQLEMESLGKQIDREGQPLKHASAPVVWGEPGNCGQHAFYQLIHQGGKLIPCEFLAFIEPGHALPGHHEGLLAHCFAQSEALMRGKTLEEARAELAHAAATKTAATQAASTQTASTPAASTQTVSTQTVSTQAAVSPALTCDLAPYKTFPGNQPSTTLLFQRLTPFALGQLIALYEHKVSALGALWNINAYDQWGVEYGKQLAGRLQPLLTGEAALVGGMLDSSTAGLIAHVRANTRVTGPAAD